MTYDEFVATVSKALGTDPDAAEEAIGATLRTLAERLGADESLVWVSQLPPELGPWLYTTGGPRSFDAEEFVRRVAGREQVDPETAERHAAAVLAALARAVGDTEYRHLVARLSRDYTPLLPKGPDAGAVPLSEFLAGVAERAGAGEHAEVRRSTEAVLETLAERIAPGDVDDLIGRLPVALHGALKRGRASGSAATRRMKVDEFLRRVAQRAGLPPDRTREYARAVLVTLRRLVPEEYFDISVQLPAEYGPLLR
jgi:uncharacterized protein (DUF2267 family)